MTIQPEPNFATACEWWDDLQNIWTPIGWKNHLFRFNVFWNGMILAHPNLDGNRRTKAWKGQGVQLTFAPHYTEWHEPSASSFIRHDDGMVRQGWNDSAAPVLWTEWSNDGVLLRQEVFAHIPGGQAIETGIEPLFAWVRLSIYDMCTDLPLEDVHGFNILIEAPHVLGSMFTHDNLWFFKECADYPRRLAPANKKYNKRAGFHLLEKGGKVRLAVAPGQVCKVIFNQPFKQPSTRKLTDITWGQAARHTFRAQPWPRIHIQMPAKKGQHVDVLVPMLPTDRNTFDAELTMGYDNALKEANHFWSKKPRTAATFSVPETFLCETVKHGLKFAEVIAERNPATGLYSMLTGSFSYSMLWSTPMSMAFTMLLDTMGYHEVVERYLELFRKEQGTVVPPSSCFKEVHPGYYSSPKSLTSIDWLSDHGAILYSVAEHALLSGDRKFARRWAESIAKACEFIRDARAMTNHNGIKGVLPPAVATDRCIEIQAVWSIGWNYKGLTAAVKLLRQIGHPRAKEFAVEARDYKAGFVKAFRDKCKAMPWWKDKRGHKHTFAPTSLAGDDKSERRHAFYLDTGPLFLVYAGLMDAKDPLMQDMRLWFREGSQRALYRRDSNGFQVPVLDHEISSCEPCYSWNIFHSHQLGDRRRFLEGMYSLFAGAISRKTYISVEIRGGITGNNFAAPLALYLARLAVIDDQIKDQELHLLRMMPLAWLEKGQESCFKNMPTVYGPMTLRTRLQKNRKMLEVDCLPKFHTPPKKVVLHFPPVDGFTEVQFNGKKIAVKGKQVVVNT